MGALERKPGGPDNWVEKVGGLPAYIERIAKSLHEKRGFTISRSIATAVSMCKRWAAGGEDVNPDTRAKAAKAVAEWEAKKARAHVDMSNLDVGGIDLAAMSDEDALDLAYGDHRPPYDWKHGYLPISPQAARIKAKKEAAPRGNRGGSSTATVASRSIKKAAAAKKTTAPKRKPAVAGRPAERTPAQRKAADDAQRGRGVPGADTGSSRPASTPGVRGLMRAELGSGDPTPAQRTAARDELSKMTPEQLRALRDGTSSTEVSNEVTGELAKRQRAAVTGSRGDGRGASTGRDNVADAAERKRQADAARPGNVARDTAGLDTSTREGREEYRRREAARAAAGRAATPPPAKPSLRDRLGGETSDLDTAKQKAADMRGADITRVNRLAGQGDAAAIAEQKRRQTPAYKRAKAKADQEANGRYMAANKARREQEERDRPAREEAENKARREREAAAKTKRDADEARSKAERERIAARDAEQRRPAQDAFQAKVAAGEFPMQRRPWSQIPKDYRSGSGAERRVMVAGPGGSTMVPYFGPERGQAAGRSAGSSDTGQTTKPARPGEQRVPGQAPATIADRSPNPREGRGGTRDREARMATDERNAQAIRENQLTMGRDDLERILNNPESGPAAKAAAKAALEKRDQHANRITPDTARRMSDAQLEATLDRLAAAGDYSSPAFKAVEAEQTRRDDTRSSAEGNRPRR